LNEWPLGRTSWWELGVAVSVDINVRVSSIHVTVGDVAIDHTSVVVGIVVAGNEGETEDAHDDGL
jgi:hypothetical protein